MNLPLKSIASIQTGLYLKPEPFGDTLYIQGKDFGDNGDLIKSTAPTIQGNAKLEKHLLKDGDLLVMAKGNRNTAYLFNGESGKALASSTFLVVRLSEKEKEKILPAYLAWFISHPQSQLFLGSHSKGSGISSLTVGSLGELEISIPDVQTQKAILKIDQLRNTGKKLKQKIEVLQDQKIQQQIFNAIK